MFRKSATSDSNAKANRPWHHVLQSATRNSTATVNRPWRHGLALAAFQELHHKQRLCVVSAGSWAQCSIQQRLKATV